MCSTAMLVLAVLPALCASSLVKAVSFKSEAQEFEAAEVADQQFLATQWRALESDMLSLQQHLAAETHSSGFLQLRASPVAHAVNQTAKPELKDKPKVQKPSEPKKLAAKMEPSDLSKPKPDKLAAAESMMKGLTGQAMLAPMLGMLKGMYEDQKKRIGDINKKETLSKTRFAQQQAEFDAKLKSIKDKHDHHKLDDEFFKNETRDTTRQFKYWEGVRSRNHRQFHNALKITHGMMQNEKNMISKYEAAMSMKAPEEKKAKAAPVEEPEVSFVQARKAVVAFIQEHLTEVRQQLAETLTADHA